MALSKNKMTDFGIEAGYWKVCMVSINRCNREASFSLNLFLSKDSNKFLESYVVTIIGNDELYSKYFESKLFTDIHNACYICTKDTQEYFKDAIDC